MIKLLIADDEKNIIQLICKLLDFERYPIELVGEATDGLTAFEMVQTLQPDILITDIKMPCLNGLDLIEKIRQLGISIHIIVISGHKEFDYAYSAIKYGVDDFIIKPINRADLNDTIGKIYTQIQSGQAAPAPDAGSALRHGAEMGKMRVQLILDAIAGVKLPASLAGLNKNYAFGFEAGCFVGICIKLDLPDLNGDYSAVMGKCRKTARECFADYAVDMEFAIVGCRLWGLINLRHANEEKLYRRVKKLYEMVALELDIYSHLLISIGVGCIVDTHQDIQKTLDEAGTYARLKCIFNSPCIFYSGNMGVETGEVQLPGMLGNKLRVLMESCDTKAIGSWLQAVFKEPPAEYQERPVYALALMDAVVKIFFSMCDILAVHVDPEMRQQWMHELDNARGLVQTLETLRRMMTDVMETDYQQRLERESYPVSCTKEYIVRHLNEQIKLEDIALNVHLSPSYLSMLFKRETGENISDYMQYLRIEEAKRLLKSTNLYVNEIAERVGYTDPKHFSKLFKKQIGSQPQEYRKLYSW